MAEDKPEYLLKKLRFKELLELAKRKKLDTKKKKKASVVRAILKKVSGSDIRGFYAELKGSSADITAHALVPKHEIMKKKDIESALKQFHCKLTNLPRIMDTDAMCLKIAARPGDVLKITRDSATAGEAYYYRLVVRSI